MPAGRDELPAGCVRNTGIKIKDTTGLPEDSAGKVSMICFPNDLPLFIDGVCLALVTAGQHRE